MDHDLFLKRAIVISTILLLLAASVMLLMPIAISIFTGLILAYLCYPLYKFVLKWVKVETISALIIVLLVLFLIFLPFWFLFPVISKQFFDFYLYLQKADISSIIASILPSSLSQDSAVIVNNFINKISNYVFSQASNLLLNIPSILLKMTIVLFVFFFGMRDGERMKNFAKGLSPFSAEAENGIIKQFKDITNSVLYGNVLVGILQGLCTGIAFYFLGVPQALLLTFATMFFAIIPTIGAWIVWLPVAIWLIISGKVNAGIILLVYGAIVVSWIDNIIRPYIVSRKTKTSSGIVFVGMIGGLIVFGLLGLILGPLILSYLITLLEAYKNKQLSKLFA